MTEVGPPVPRSDFRLPRSRAMRRILIVSHTYIPPSNRGKLRALAARGLEVTVGVPQRWRETVLGLTLEVAWERQNGVEVFPLPVRHHGDPAGETPRRPRSEEHTSELQSQSNLVCRLLLEK